VSPSVRTIPFFNYPDVFVADEAEVLATVSRAGRRGAFIMQAELPEFERNIAKFVGAKFAVGAANATDGLHMALRAAGIQSGDEVIASTHTMIATKVEEVELRGSFNIKFCNILGAVRRVRA
jgi:dTDP-4-amino-4,6-dideoxygalactose transaminase